MIATHLDAPPISIRNIEGLGRLPDLYNGPGIYFLVRNDKVVYVGQSINVSSRALDHQRDRIKAFDKTYIVNVPVGKLDNVEKAFIVSMHPEYNARHNAKHKTNKRIYDFSGRALRVIHANRPRMGMNMVDYQDVINLIDAEDSHDRR